MAKTDVKINLSEVLVHLRDSGAFRAAVMKVAQSKAPGAEIGEITLSRDSGELSEKDLKAVTGGITSSLIGTIPQTARYSFEPEGARRLAGFADTKW
jgi:hypothetical protein